VPRADFTNHTPVSGPRYPALLTAAIIACGILFADHIGWQPSTWIAISLSALSISGLLLMCSRSRWTVFPPLAAMILLFAVGGVRLTMAICDRPSSSLAQLMTVRSPVVLEGRLTDTPRSRLSGWQAPVDLQSVQTKSGTRQITGRVLISGPHSLAGLRYGDSVRLHARLRAPNVRRNPGGFDYADFLFRQGIDGIARPTGPVGRIAEGAYTLAPSNLVEPVRDWIRAVFTRYLNPTPRALILGFLIGETDQLPPKLYDSVRNSGTLHLLAVSGANVWLIVGMVMLVLRPLRIHRLLRTIVLMLVVILFSFLTRNEPSVVRASIMVAAILLGRLCYHPIAALNAVGLSGAIILLVSPLQIFRPGFQLSYAAVIAIIVIGTRTLSALPSRRHRWRRMLIAVSLSSVAATTATAPLLAFHFGTVPIAALPANLVMIPIASAAAYIGAVLLACSAISSWATALLAYPMTWVLQLFVVVAAFFARLPHAVIDWPQPSLLAITNYYLILLLAINWRYRYRWFRPIVRYALVVAFAVSLLNLRDSTAGDLVMVFPDLGNRRVVGIGHPDGNLVWLADDPGIDNDLRQWTIDPLIRVTYPKLKSELKMSWRRNDSIPQFTLRTPGAVITPQWIRFLTILKDESDARRVWADLFTYKSDSITVIRDYPDTFDANDWPPSLRSHLAVLPAHGSHERIQEAIGQLNPRMVIFYGSNRWSYEPDQWLERWRARFPEVDFWATMLHGGLTVRAGSGVTIRSTIEETCWIDPDL